MMVPKGGDDDMQLHEARRQRLLSVRKLAEAAGVAPSTVYYIEHGKTAASFRAIRDISAALDMDPLDIDEFAAVIEGTGAGKAVAA
jgi:transcriptional regulator with XRE-family HTH domain